MGRAPKSENGISAVYVKYSDMLYRIALMQIGNPDDAMDAVQDVFLKYIKKNLIFSSDEHEKAWFIRAVINRCRDIYRKNVLRSHEDISVAENLVYSEHFSENHRELLELTEQLPEKIKTVIVLHYLEDMSIDNIAKTLKISVSAVKMRLLRGRESLKLLLEEEEFNV